MSYSKNFLLTSICSALIFGSSAKAEDALQLSGNVGIYSDYRFRGVSLSDEDFAIQGGLDLSYGSFYLGSWGSSIESFNGAETELDLYGGVQRELAGINFSAGFLLFLFPGADNSNYVEITGSASKDFDLAQLTFGFNYAPDQDNIGDQDNIYLYSGVSAPVSDTPFSLDLGFGYEDGAFGNDKLDWYVGTSASFYGLDFSVRYIDTDAAGQFGTTADATVVFSVGASF